MTLALAFGRTLAELEATLGDELRWWKAYNLLSPIGQQRDDALMALSTSAILNAWAKEAPTPPQLMPEWFKPTMPGMPRTKAAFYAMVDEANARAAEAH